MLSRRRDRPSQPRSPECSPYLSTAVCTARCADRSRHEPNCRRARLNEWSRVECFVRVSILRTVRHQDVGLTVALGINFGVYAGIVACFAAGLFWLMQPKVLQNHGLAAYKPPPGTVVIYTDPARLPPAPSEPIEIRGGGRTRAPARNRGKLGRGNKEGNQKARDADHGAARTIEPLLGQRCRPLTRISPLVLSVVEPRPSVRDSG